MIRHLAPIAVALTLLGGCGETVITDDMGATSPYDCRAPSACYTLNCNCLRASVTTLFPSGCLVCDPSDPANTSRSCMCNMDLPDGEAEPTQQCVEPVELCVGTSATPCPGLGARCLPAGSTCATAGGDPPDLVAVATQPDGGAATEQRCTYADDVCCPGVVTDDLGVADQSVPPLDLATTD